MITAQSRTGGRINARMKDARCEIDAWRLLGVLVGNENDEFEGGVLVLAGAQEDDTVPPWRTKNRTKESELELDNADVARVMARGEQHDAIIRTLKQARA